LVFIAIISDNQRTPLSTTIYWSMLFGRIKGGSRHVPFAWSDPRIRIVDAYHDRICGRVIIRVSWYAISIRRYDTVRPMSCRLSSDHQRYNDDTTPWSWLLCRYGCGANQLVTGLDTIRRYGYGDRIRQMIMSGPTLRSENTKANLYLSSIECTNRCADSKLNILRLKCLEFSKRSEWNKNIR
jgi:hypothetical protein